VRIKHDEPNRNSADPRLRNRPRIDYSLFWGPNPVPSPVSQNGERKRKRREETDEFGEPTNLGVFDVSVYAGIDYEKLRQIKRSRLGVDPLSDDHNNLDEFLVPLSSSSSDEGFWENDVVDDIPPSSVSSSLFEDPVPSSFPDVQNETQNNNITDKDDDKEEESSSSSPTSKQQIMEYPSLAPIDTWEPIVYEEPCIGLSNVLPIFRVPPVINGSSDAQTFSSASVDDDTTKCVTQSQPEIQPESYFT